MSNLDLAVNLVSTPQVALAELRQRPKFLFPLLTLVLGTVAVLTWYYLVVDIDWLRDAMISADPRMSRMTPEQRQQAENFMSRNFLLLSAVISTAVVLVVLRLLEALYFMLAGKLTNLQLSFKHWFALANWTSLPLILGAVASAVYLASSSTNQIGAGELAVLSLNELALHIPFGGKGYTLASALTLLQPWCWWLTIAGIRLWSGRSWLFSSMFVLIPILALYGGWALWAWR